MTTPARIATFLSTSAFCLGLSASAVNATPVGRGTSPPMALEDTRAEARGEVQAPSDAEAAQKGGDAARA